MQQRTTAYDHLLHLLVVSSFFAFVHPISTFANSDSSSLDGPLPLLVSQSGNLCTLSFGVGLANRPSAFVTLHLPGRPVLANLYWSGRDRDGKGDDTIRVNEFKLPADTANRAESGGGSWWHTYVVDVLSLITPLVSESNRTVSLEIGGLSFQENLAGEAHGALLQIVYESEHCPESQINIHFGLDSFKHTAQMPIHGPNSAVTCTYVEPVNEERQVELSLSVGGINNKRRDTNLWIATSAENTPPESLINQNHPPLNAQKIVDPLGNDPRQRQWDHFQVALVLPPNHSHICLQIEGTGALGASAVLVNLTVRVVQSSEPSPAIAGRVWLDADQDGQLNADEDGIANIVVLLRSAHNNSIIRARATSASGEYHFSNLVPAPYVVDVAEELFAEDLIQTGDPDGVLDTQTLVELTHATSATDVNFGFAAREPLGSITGEIWSDINGNGERDEEDDRGIEEVAVILLDGTHNLIAEQLTNETGSFSFQELTRRPYTVQVRQTTLPDDAIQTFEVDGTLNGSVEVDLTAAPNQTNISFGYGTVGQIVGRLWADQNANGTFDSDEVGIDNALLLLTDEGGVGRVAVTQNGGVYRFGRLMPGTYSLVVVMDTIVPGAIPTFEVDGVLDGTVVIEVSVSEIVREINFGFDLGIRGSSNSVPRLDLSVSEIDLSNEEAIVGLIQAIVLGGSGEGEGDQSTAPEAEETTEPPPEPNLPAQNEAQLAGDDVSDPIEQPNDEQSVPGHTPQEGETYQIHFPLVQ